MNVTFFAIPFLFSLLYTTAAPVNYLQQCWDKQVGGLHDSTIILMYRASQHTLYHSPEPWQTIRNQSTGKIWCGSTVFHQCDTVAGTKYVSKIQFNPDELLIQYYWKDALQKVTNSTIEEELLETADYSPIVLINRFRELRDSVGRISESTANKQLVSYSVTINSSIVTLFIRTSDTLVEKITIQRHHDILGDITTAISYSDYTTYHGVYYSKNIHIRKVHDVVDSITVEAHSITSKAEPLLRKPPDYSVQPDTKVKPDVRVEKIASGIYSVLLLHAESRSALIEFKDFFVVIDAPLTSENGELIIKEAAKLNPDKPIKYFTFGHHHPWYIGGIRAFIHKGATILCTKDDVPFVQFIATAPHSLQPDSLHLQNKKLTYKVIDSTFTISDATNELQLFHIGMKSAHTKDYFIYYIPAQHLVFEGDLAAISKDGTITKASRTETGLYSAINDLGLHAQTVIQQWPEGSERKSKSVFTFRELEQKINVK